MNYRSTFDTDHFSNRLTREHLDTRFDTEFAKIQTEIANSKNDIVRWVVGTILTATALFIAAMKLF